ncbi:MAG: transcriptional regulator [Oxalobacteraceae bacterium]|nr:MAG: transcriptional regulator [Oxalobacteraceae bacterium]
MTTDTEKLISLTAGIVAAHVGNNNVSVNDVPTVIANVYSALAGLSGPIAEAAPERPRGAVSVRASIKPDHLVSMIDGKSYTMLKRHLTQNGYTPASYRETFGLPRNYPMVAPNYVEKRRAIAVRNGLGRKPGTKVAKPGTSKKS